MSTTTSRRPVRRALVTALAVGAASLAVTTVAAPAQADDAVASGDLTWGLSTYLNSANMGRPNPKADAYVAPASFDATARTSSWGEATGTVLDDGSASVAFAGTSVNFAATSGAWLRIADPQVEVDAEGNGVLTADVAYGRSATGVPPAMSYDPAQAPQRARTGLEVLALSGNTADDVATVGGTTTFTGLEGAWSDDLLAFLAGDAEAEPAVPGFIYAGQVNNATEGQTPAPLTFAVETAVPTVAVTTVSTSYADGVTLRVDGSDFTPVTNPGDAGVYVGLAEAGEFPDTGSFDTSAFAAVDWVTPARFTDGSWTSTLNAPTAALDPGTAYAIFTWQAHTHSNPSQDTQTPVAIDFSKLQPPAPAKVGSRVVAKAPKRPTTTKGGKLNVRVVAQGVRPTGKVTLVLKRGKTTVRRTTRPARPTAVVWNLPKLRKGAYQVVAAYGGSPTVKASRAVVRFRVNR